MTKMRYVVVVLMLAGVQLAAAQDDEGSSPYFECPYINYFDDGCPQMEPEQSRVAPPGQEEPEPPERVEDGHSDYEQHLEDNPELLLPLFPKESLAPDTPALYRLLLINPTLETARRYVRWYERRMSRIREAMALVEVAGRELLAERARQGSEGP